jgi:hypothetical protein
MNNSGRLTEPDACPACASPYNLRLFNAVAERDGTIRYFGGAECECGYLEIAGRRVQDGDDDPQGA